MADTRLTLRQAAAVLDVSESAIRKRVERGTLRSDKGPDGRRYVYLDTVADNMVDEGAETSAPPERDALISGLRAHNDTLREQLEAERQAHAEARRIIAGLVERIPAIGAPQETSQASGTIEEEPEVVSPSNSAATEHMVEATDTEEDMDRITLKKIAVTLFITTASLLIAYTSAINETFSSTISSVLDTFSTAVSSGLSALTGDQIVTIISTIIGAIATLVAAYLTIRFVRGSRNR
jgi:hypothetical protein